MSPLLVLFFGCFFILTNAKTLNSQLLLSEIKSQSLDVDGEGCFEDNPTLKCSVETCKELQAKVKMYHVEKCDNQLDDQYTLKKKLSVITKLKKARIQINGVCFGGGDSGHQMQVQQAITMEFNCQDYLKKFAN